jgi:hypothetical protein
MAKGRKKAKSKKPAPKRGTKKPFPKKPSPRKPVAPRQRDFRAEYAKRIAKALAAGKTKQAGRGHKAHEHIERREREVAEAGITGSQLRSIREFLKRFNPIGFKEIPDEETLVEFVQKSGYPAFQQYRKIWDAARRQYVKEKKAGTYESRGLQYLHHLTGMAEAPDEKWLYYH